MNNVGRSGRAGIVAILAVVIIGLGQLISYFSIQSIDRDQQQLNCIFAYLSETPEVREQLSDRQVAQLCDLDKLEITRIRDEMREAVDDGK